MAQQEEEVTKKRIILSVHTAIVILVAVIGFIWQAQTIWRDQSDKTSALETKVALLEEKIQLIQTEKSKQATESKVDIQAIINRQNDYEKWQARIEERLRFTSK